MSRAVFKVFRVWLALKRETNGSPQPLVYFLPYGKDQEQGRSQTSEQDEASLECRIEGASRKRRLGAYTPDNFEI